MINKVKYQKSKQDSLLAVVLHRGLCPVHPRLCVINLGYWYGTSVWQHQHRL